MTLLSLARAWINNRFDSEMFVINSKKIYTTGIKGEIIIQMNLTANDCSWIATGSTFNVEFLLRFINNRLTNKIIKSDTLNSTELKEFQ